MSSTYLELTNFVLRRINQTSITDVTAATGHALIITEMINEGQRELATIVDWNSLYTDRTFATVAGTATYAVASDHMRTISLRDTTNNIVLFEDFVKAQDYIDPNNDSSGISQTAALTGSNFTLYPIPSGVFTIAERYYKVPATLTANGDTSDLPDYAENSLIYWAWFNILEYLEKTTKADRVRIEFLRILKNAKIMNSRLLPKRQVMSQGLRGHGDLLPQPPQGLRYWSRRR